MTMERTLEVKLTCNGDGKFNVKIFENESGDHVGKTFNFIPFFHRKFSEWLFDEVYSWIELMQDEVEEEE